MDIMEICHECLKKNAGNIGVKNLLRCPEHLNLPEGALGAVIAIKTVSPQHIGGENA